MRKGKRIVAALMAAIMLVSLVACGKTKEPKEVLSEAVAEIKNAPAVSFTVSGNLGDEQTDSGFVFTVDGSANKNAGATLEITAKAKDKTFNVTDVILTSDKTLYVNIDKMLFFLNSSEVLGALAGQEGDEQDDADFSFDLSSITAMLSGLSLPTYLRLPLESADEGADGAVVDTPDVNEYKPVADAFKEIYEELVVDKEIFTYSKKDEVVNIVVNESTIDKITTSMSYYFSPNPEKAEIFFGTIVPLLPDETIEAVYSDLRIELNTDENEEIYFGYKDFVEEKMEDIKAFVTDHPYTTKDIVKNRMTECFTSLIPEALNIKIDVKNKYTVTVSREKENKSETLMSIIIAPLEKAVDEVSVPSDSAGLEDIIGQLFGGFTFEDNEDTFPTE